MNIGLMFAAAALCASPPLVEAQSDQRAPAPRVLVESVRVTDSLSREAAVQLRTALRARVNETVLQVVSTEVTDKAQQARRGGLGHAWDWSDVREFSRQVSAQYIIDIAAVRDSTMVRLVAFVVHPPRTGEPEPVPVFTGQ